MKKRNVFKRIEAKRHLIPVLLVIAVLLSGMCVLPGCSLKGINNTKKEEIDNKRLYIYGCRLWNYDNEWLQYKR